MCTENNRSLNLHGCVCRNQELPGVSYTVAVLSPLYPVDAYRIPSSLGHHGEPSPSQDLFPQVGAIGDEEEWVTLYEEENEPDAQTLEIPNLTPYTHYR